MIYVWWHVFFLGAFAKLRKATISFIMSVCLSVCPSVCLSVCDLVSAVKPFVGFSWNSVQNLFTISRQLNVSLLTAMLFWGASVNFYIHRSYFLDRSGWNSVRNFFSVIAIFAKIGAVEAMLCLRFVSVPSYCPICVKFCTRLAHSAAEHLWATW